MAIAPILKPIQNRTGILYTFQSALEDINLTISNTGNDVRFSKFALLRIPEIGTPDSIETDNKIQFYAQGESFMLEGLNADHNVNLAQSFQSYALNLETLLISRDDYRRENRLTVAERVFWKWLKEMGAIRFKDANNLQKNVDTLGTAMRWVEDDDPSSTYNRVVKYIADIDATNSVRSTENSYTEIYIHVPTNVGSTPYVLFDSIEDENYFSNMTITNNPPDPLNIEYLAGRKYNETHPFGLSMKAYYDLDDQSILTEITDNISDPNTYVPGYWFNGLINNSYYTDISSNYSVAKNQRIRKTLGSTSIEYVRNTLDGIQIDWDLTNYRLAYENKEIKVFSQFNDYVNNTDFEYNAILIYYDVFDPNDLDEEGKPKAVKTNLYGIQFLNKVEQDGLEFKIPCVTKYKPDPLNKINGNAFSHKPNIKLDNSIENVLVERSVNDYNTLSMDLFMDVLSEFKEIQSNYNNELLKIQSLRQDVEDIKDLLLNTEDLNEIKIRLDQLETSLLSTSSYFNDINAIMRLIESNADAIDNILRGESSINISYNLDVIRPGLGIDIDRRTPNRAIINTTVQKYNIDNDSIFNLDVTNMLKLGYFTNYKRHENSGIRLTFDRDQNLYIDDSDVTWKKNQTFRLVFHDEIDPDIYELKIYTDYYNKTNNGSLNHFIGVFNKSDFESSGFKPIFEIICIDDENLTFVIDKIR